MERGVGNIQRSLLLAAGYATEQFQLGNPSIVEDGFERLKSMNIRLVAVREAIRTTDDSMQLTITQVNNGVADASERQKAHTKCMDVMSLVNELSREARMFIGAGQ